MEQFPDVYISLTSYCTRINRILKKNLLVLFEQDYCNIKTIFVTIPLQNMKGDLMTEPIEWLSTEEPFKSKVTLLRPEKDYGPIMKWLGPAKLIPDKSFVFICDDDQQYTKNYISECVRVALRSPNPHKTIVHDLNQYLIPILGIKPGRIIAGFAGVLTNTQHIQMIVNEFDASKLDPCCLRIDDDVVSYMTQKHDFEHKHIDFHFIKYDDEPADALHTRFNRNKDRFTCYKQMSSEFNNNLLSIIIILSVACLVLLVLLIYFIYRNNVHYKLLQQSLSVSKRI